MKYYYFIILLFILIFIIFININNNKIRRLTDNISNLYIKYEKILNYELNLTLKRYPNCKSDFLVGCKFLEKRFKPLDSSVKPKLVNISFPILFNEIINEKPLCNDKSLIIGIACSPNHFKQRYIYRKIYNKYSNIKYYFFMGKSYNNTINDIVKDESKIYHDIIQFSYMSSYFNITVQFVSISRWINKNCNNYKYYVYHQPDVFLNIPFYEKTFGNIETKAVIGKITHLTKTSRKKTSKWYVPYEVYPDKYLPDYPQGSCIFFSESTTKSIVHAADNCNRIVPIDDIYIGLILQYENITSLQYDASRNIIIYPRVPVSLDKYLFIHSLQPDLVYYYASLV